jgi:hypothetical protein
MCCWLWFFFLFSYFMFFAGTYISWVASWLACSAVRKVCVCVLQYYRQFDTFTFSALSGKEPG